MKIAGWLEGTGLAAVEVARRVKAAGVRLVEYTDVGRDGMFTGVDADGRGAASRPRPGSRWSPRAASRASPTSRPAGRAGLAGVIVGKALYEGRIDLAEAIRAGRGG